ncbi:MAG TPA: hypothetical protein VHV31_06885, partial [Nitrolancea sp.]|nr:hypothetical protein [Nitrolancea sp.]
LYAFAATKDKSRRFINYQGSSRLGRRVVFEQYSHQYEGKTYTHYRHLAMNARFATYEGGWFLEITPTYLFTVDGRRLYLRNAERLQGIKRLERQNAVRQQLLLWANHLQRQGDLITSEYPYLSFGELEEFRLDVGIEDQAWQRRDENYSVESDHSGDARQIQMEFKNP